ncbi:MAG: ABC transporter permease [Chloroflexi bacterium]|nr:ABC transporter permease [Chloroflexota bacterium]
MTRSTVSDARPRRRVGAALLVVPTALWYVGFLLAPLVVLVVMSVGERSPNGGYAPALTLEQYANLTSRITPLTNTLGLAALNTVICALVAFPVAYTLALKVRGHWKLILVALVIVPFWTSFLIRTYAWMTLLGTNGIPRILDWIGFGDIQLLNTPFAVSLGIVYNYLPLMVLPIYVSLDRLDRSFMEASRDLGAGPIATIRQIVLPLAAPGILSGIVLVFIPVMGEYLIPILLGGGKTYFLGNALADLFLQSRNWPFGSALAVVFVIGMIVLVAAYLALSRRLVRSGRETSLV